MSAEGNLSNSEARRLDARFKLLSDAMHAFAEATIDGQRLVDTIARRLADDIGDSCSVLVLSDDGRVLVPVANHGAHPAAAGAIETLHASTPLLLHENVPAKRTLETGEPLLIARVDPVRLRAGAQPAYADLREKVGTHSILLVALRVRGQSLGMLSLTRFRPGSPPFDEGDRDLAQILADHAALAISNSRSYEAERAARAAAEKAATAQRVAEARFRRLTESGIIGHLATRLDGRVLDVNESISRMLGYSREELLSGALGWRELTPPEHADVDRRAIEQLRTTGVAGTREKEYLHKDGHRVPVLVGTAMIEGTDGEAISFVLDLSERKRTEQALAELTRERAADATMRGLLDAAPDAMVAMSEDGRIAFANGQAEKLFGHGRDEMIGQPIELLVPERFRAGHPALRDAYFRNPTARPIGAGVEVVGLRKDGSEFPAELSLSPMKTADTMLVIAAVRDITERRRAEEVRARLAAIVDSSHDAIIGKTLDGIITSWNGGAELIFGYAPSEVIGRSIRLLVPAERWNEETELLEHLRRGAVRQFDTVRICKDGRRIDVSVTSSPVRDSRGKVIGASKVARDISERKRGEEALLRAKEQAEAANRELEAFSYSVAHDLRAPLRGMNGFAQILIEDHADQLDAEGKGWLAEIIQSSEKMAQLIDALLSMSRLTRTELRRQPVDLSALVRATASALARAEPEREVEVVVASDLHAHADLTLAQALIENVIGNAWKFTSRTAAARIEVGSVEHEGGPAFFVRDNGAGFDMAFAKKLFAPFQRLHAVTEFPGSGIGLANVQRIVHRHGGRVWAEGHVGAGATFFFTLPGGRE